MNVWGWIGWGLFVATALIFGWFIHSLAAGAGPILERIDEPRREQKPLAHLRK